jgi:choloylglycine hydrolase
VRALGYTQSIEKKPSGPESVRLAEHIINNFDIPKGWVRDKHPGDEPLEYTQWSTIADIANRTYYVKSYEDPVLRAIDLRTFDLDAKTTVSAPLTPAMTPPALAFPKR